MNLPTPEAEASSCAEPSEDGMEDRFLRRQRTGFGGQARLHVVSAFVRLPSSACFDATRLHRISARQAGRRGGLGCLSWQGVRIIGSLSDAFFFAFSSIVDRM